MTKYYAATNTYASETSIGFGNTWIVLAFETRAARDAYVAAATDRATRAITRREIPEYARRDGDFQPFSGQKWVIFPGQDYPGCIGQVGAGYESQGESL